MNLKKEGQPAEVRFKLAKAWQVKGKIEPAIAGYQEVLRIQPDYAPAYQELGNLMLKQGRIAQAHEYYDKALSIDADATDLSQYYTYFGFVGQKPESQVNKNQSLYPQNNPAGKINLYNQEKLTVHRSGWSFAINALKPLHNSQGILFDEFLESTFSWKHHHEGFRPRSILEKMKRDGTYEELATSEEKGIIPYTQPWVGFLHNPQQMPVWFNSQDSLPRIFAKDVWKRSIDYCVGLFALSEYHAQWIRQQTGKPVSALIHPTEIPEIQFDFDEFKDNPQKKIVQIGWWLRKLNSIYQFPLASNNSLKYEKIKLNPNFFNRANEHLTKLAEIERERYQLNLDSEFVENTKEVQHLTNEEYDRLLSENIAFVDLYDSSANNAVIECIARGTPLLINPLPPVIEYLGKDYPMYFSSLAEAAEKALDVSLIQDTHEYLKNCETRKKLSPEYFLKSFEESEVYQLINLNS